MSTNKPSFQAVLDALVDESQPLNPRYLPRFSDLGANDRQLLEKTWPKISSKRKQTLLEELEEAGQDDDVLLFDFVCSLGVRDEDALVRRLAVGILGEYEMVEHLPTFLALLELDEDKEVRAAAASALGSYVYMGELEELSQSSLQRVVTTLLKVVKGQDVPLVRIRALEGLGFSSEPEVPPLIEAAYDSGENEWVAAALNAMGRSASPEWKTQVLAVLQHASPLVRAEAASAAGELELGEARGQLLELLDDHDYDVRTASIWALSQLGGEGVRDALEDLLEHTEHHSEIEQIELALENLDFTDETRSIFLFDMEDQEFDTEEDEDTDD